MQLESGMSISRYLPARGTAGFERYFVRGRSRDPWPPPSTTATTLDIELSLYDKIDHSAGHHDPLDDSLALD